MSSAKQPKMTALDGDTSGNTRRSHEIGQRIKQARLSRKPKMSQNDLARKIGLTAGAVGQWEIGNNAPSGPTLDKLAKVLKCSRNWILFGQDTAPEPNSPSAIGQRIMGLREKLGWSHLALAVKLGVDPGNVSRWESGDICPSMAEMDRLAEVFGTSRTWILTGQAAENSAPQDIVEQSILEQVRGRKVEEKAQILYLLENWRGVDLDPMMATEALQRFAELTPESRQAALAMMGGLPKTSAARQAKAAPRSRKRVKNDA